MTDQDSALPSEDVVVRVLLDGGQKIDMVSVPSSYRLPLVRGLLDRGRTNEAAALMSEITRGMYPRPRASSDSSREVTSTIQVEESLERLSNTPPAEVNKIITSQLELLTAYHNVVLDQARRSFRWALVAAVAGSGFFLAAVAFVLVLRSQNASWISLLSGAVVEVIASINFYLYGKTTAQTSDFQVRLEVVQRYMLANSVCEGLTGDLKNQTRAELVKTIARIT